MLRADSLRTSTWVTNDGRYLTVDEITDDHLRRIRLMLCTDMTPGYDQTAGRRLARDWMEEHENLLDYDGVELDRDAYAAAWIQIIDDEFAKRSTQPAH